MIFITISKEHIVEKIISIHTSEYSTKPEIIVSAPGVINILGTHTDYNEGFVLQAGLNRTLHVAISRRDDNSLRFFSNNLNERKKSALINMKYKREDRWANFIKGVIQGFLNRGYPIKGMNLSINSSIPIGVGMGSSSALMIAAAKAVDSLLNLGVDETGILQIVDWAESSFLDLRREMTNNLTVMKAVEGGVLFLDMRRLRVEPLRLDMGEYEFVVTDSNIPVSVNDQYFIDRQEDCVECVRHLNKRKSGSTLRDFSVLDMKQSMGSIPESIRRVCMHVVLENKLVQEGKKAILKKDALTFGKLLNKSHESLRDNFEVSCPEIDWLVKRACEIDYTVGSRITSPGFCGSTISLMKKEQAEIYREKLTSYEHIFGFMPEIYTLKPSGGVTIVPVNGK